MQDEIKYIELSSLSYDNIVINEVKLIDESSYDVITFNKSPNNNYSCIIKASDKLYLVILDNMMNPVNNFIIPIDISNKIYGNFYWLDEDTICFSASDNDDKTITYIINLSSGEIVNRIENKRIVSFSREYEKVIMKEAEEYSIYDTKLNLIKNFTLPDEFYFSQYSDMVIWNDINEFLVISHGKYIISYNIDTSDTNVYDINNDYFSIIKSLGNNQLIIINTERIHNEEPFNW